MDAKNDDMGHTVERRIRVDDAYDVQMWSLVLHVTPETLVAAAILVGPDAQDVKDFLDRQSTGSAGAASL